MEDAGNPTYVHEGKRYVDHIHIGKDMDEDIARRLDATVIPYGFYIYPIDPHEFQLICLGDGRWEMRMAHKVKYSYVGPAAFRKAVEDFTEYTNWLASEEDFEGAVLHVEYDRVILECSICIDGMTVGEALDVAEIRRKSLWARFSYPYTMIGPVV